MSLARRRYQIYQHYTIPQSPQYATVLPRFASNLNSSTRQKTPEPPSEERLKKGEHITSINTHDVVCVSHHHLCS